MKNKNSIILIIGAMSIWQAFADDIKTNDWGATNCGIEMSIALEETNNEVKTNQPVILTICIKNVSDGVVSFDETGMNDFSFVVISPSKKDISPKPPPESGEGLFNMLRSIQVNGSINYSFNLSSACGFNEIGTYKVTAKIKINSSCEIISNALKVSVVPGEWKSETTNAPPAGF